MTRPRKQPRQAVALRAIVYLLFVPIMVTVVIPFWLIGTFGGLWRISIGALGYVGLVPILLGVSIYCRCAWDYAVHGRGTPSLLIPPKLLATSGIYAQTRNPMPFGLGSVLIGEALVLQSASLLLVALAYWSACHCGIVVYDEPKLRQMFCPAYDLYSARVPRWPFSRRANSSR